MQTNQFANLLGAVLALCLTLTANRFEQGAANASTNTAPTAEGVQNFV